MQIHKGMDCVLSDIKKMQNQVLEGAVEGQTDMEEVHFGCEGSYWALMPEEKTGFRNNGSSRDLMFRR